MKNIKQIVFCLLIIAFTANISFAQDVKDKGKITHKIIKQNGASFIGEIISRDAHEILLKTDDIGLVFIPKHEIREIIEIEEGGHAVSGGLFSTRYFLTTNGFAINKGDNYIQWNLFGPDFQFGVADNFTMGVMTSWVGMPIIGTTKYSMQLAEKLYGGVGFLGGTGSWAFPEYGLLLPFGFISTGTPINNLNFTAGYATLFAEREEYSYTLNNEGNEYSTNGYDYNYETTTYSEGRFLFSIAGMFRINEKFSFVFDSFFMVRGKNRMRQELRDTYDNNTNKYTYYIVDEERESLPLLVLAPGLRFQANESSSFQFGFTGIHADGEFLPVPIPMVQWFKRI